MTETLIYPEDMARDGYNTPSLGIQNYNQYVTIDIYDPIATAIEENLLVGALEAAAPFAAAWATNKLSEVGGFEAIAGLLGAVGVAEIVGKTVAYANLPNDVKDILNNGLANITDDQLRRLENVEGAASIANLLKNARNSRISDSRATLGLGILVSPPIMSIVLPMPKQIKSNYGFEYSEEDFTAVNLLNTIKNVGIDLMNITSGGKIDGAALASAIGTSSADPAAKAGLASWLTTIPSGFVDKSFDLLGMNPNLTSYVQAANNRAKIPYLEKVFKNVKRRSFQMEYTFIPRSEDEVKLIYKIVKAFKKHAHPKKTNNDYYYVTPSEFVVKFEFMGTENEFLPRYGRLAIDDISVDYGSSDGFSAFRPILDSDKLMVSPSEIRISISFTELELLTQGRIEEGY